MYAIIVSGGKQYKVAEGDVICVEKLDAEIGSEVAFEALLISDGDIVVGDALKSAKVTGTVTGAGKEKKVVVYKYKRKTGYHKKNGHRQPYTEVKIDSIAK